MVEAIAVLAAGFWAGMINVVVGSGTLVTFPTLLLFGYPPLVANVSNNIGLVGGGLTGTFGYRRELRGRGGVLRRLLPASLLGGMTGAILLLVLPAAAFQLIVPGLIALGLVMVVWGPALQRRITRGRDTGDGHGHLATLTGPRLAGVVAGVYVLGIYGGYFGAAQGVLLVGLMSVLTSDDIQSVTGLKNLLTTAVNVVAAAIFLLISAGSVDWKVVGLIATGATLGGVAGAHFGRRLPPVAMRALIVVVGVAAIARMLL
ncbi:sulfite exporter TauE/SafE family protein [Dactylosporangium siamense]|uniref:sulfite exporter TauE/SafE family protein n=1 Tax=Dactylosporangium siamense TaxID=685454 RepID=UPI0019409933|nr:sulfite exporter TauE/SafE family protein [Dactylosporangium siamense]